MREPRMIEGQENGVINIGSLSYNISEAALAYASARYSRPGWATGTIQRPDAAFLFDIIRREHPRFVAELGVGAGVSTAFLSTLLSELLPGSQLYAFDNLERYYADHSRRLGDYLYEQFGTLPANLTLASGIASTEIRAWPGRPHRFDLVFLDACHLHPWPCKDLLSILDIVAPGAWIVLHDVWLPLLQRQSRQFGPLYLYQMWPGEKCAPSGNCANIGAIRLFADSSASAAALISCCKIPWYDQPPQSDWSASLQVLAGMSLDLHEPLLALLEKPAVAKQPVMRDHEIVIRGANRWSQFSPDLTTDRIILHANRRGEPDISLMIRGLDDKCCHGIVFPSISRCESASCALRVELATRPLGGMAETSRSLLLTDASIHFAVLPAPDGPFDAEVRVSIADGTENTKGAWVRFDCVHFV